MTVSDWYSFFQVCSAVTLFLAFAFGTGAVLTGLRVNKASAAQVLTLESDAAKAKRESDEKIAELRAQAEVLRADAEKSRAEIASAQAAVAKASEGMAKLQLEVVTQQERAANAEKSLLELRESLKPRHLTALQRAGLVTMLKNGPSGKVLLTCPLNDVEACEFLNEIGTAIADSGWKTERDMPRIFESRAPGIELSSRTRVPNAALQSLDNALGAIGLIIDNRGFAPEMRADLDVRILIGTNPRSFK